MHVAVIHHIHDHAGFKRVMSSATICSPLSRKSDFLMAYSVWESRESPSVTELGEIQRVVDKVCGRYAKNECFELSARAQNKGALFALGRELGAMIAAKANQSPGA
jgi:hypothetical protein